MAYWSRLFFFFSGFGFACVVFWRTPGADPLDGLFAAVVGMAICGAITILAMYDERKKRERKR
jgi:ABC-type uncharacterized transport system permease subunit